MQMNWTRCKWRRLPSLPSHRRGCPSAWDAHPSARAESRLCSRPAAAVPSARRGFCNLRGCAFVRVARLMAVAAAAAAALRSLARQ